MRLLLGVGLAIVGVALLLMDRVTVQQGGEIARAAFVAGMHEILLVGAILAFAGAVLALLLIRSRDLVASGPAVAS